MVPNITFWDLKTFSTIGTENIQYNWYYLMLVLLFSMNPKDTERWLLGNEMFLLYFLNKYQVNNGP